MPSSHSLEKPTLKPTLSTPTAVIATAISILLAFTMRSASSVPLILGAMALLFGPALIWIVFFQPENHVPRGRRIQIEDGRIRQLNATGEIVGEIDATRPYQYRILDLAEKTDPRIRLFQDADDLIFYASDPGGSDVIREALQIKWPPRPRVSAGYSG